MKPPKPGEFICLSSYLPYVSPKSVPALTACSPFQGTCQGMGWDSYLVSAGGLPGGKEGWEGLLLG